ncbi:regulatory protein RecX [Microbacterium sp. STN6]|uniref:regulatory protein RecX n=1 Tax=Microbacterium sp. STN6 TaxID=2995588 RepID=UPI0022608A61|nr:regulatory protein RecX [Microbacterium sp. STN6]MCX7521307.1 regulatory protein RecX [Microbacterium sp. STN6]
MPGEERGSSEARPIGEKTREKTKASNVSMHQLARRGMSRWELEQVLAKREVEPHLAAAELDRLESVGLLDDAALAVTLVYTQHTRRGLGRAAIAQELRRRHIDGAIIEDALSEIAEDDELERATELALKRVPQLRSVDDEVAERRLNGYLARKGYGSSTVRQAVQAAMATRRSSGVRFV